MSLLGVAQSLLVSGRASFRRWQIPLLPKRPARARCEPREKFIFRKKQVRRFFFESVTHYYLVQA